MPARKKRSKKLPQSPTKKVALPDPFGVDSPDGPTSGNDHPPKFKNSLRTRSEQLGKRMQSVLDEISNGHTIKRSCEIAGVKRELFYRWKKEYPKYAKLVDEARADKTERLESELYRRAIDGDTTASIFLLKCYDPQKFNEKLNIKHETESPTITPDSRGSFYGKLLDDVRGETS